ncbi:MAG TPA: ADP-ribosylglycohydrolase family protein, partial [Candidatus Lustribacter sp.]|nr:ADP-ribosylglycohydrolase family protein [Candidatus Lustribacter sp.]
MTVGASAGQRDRARGALVGLAVGDALGMPAQMLTRDRVAGLWGRIRGFETGPAESEIAPLMPAGRVTDDTDQAVILAELLLAGGGYVDPEAFARRLLDWESHLVARGSLDLLGPSTKRAVEAFRAGTAVTATGRWGDTNGAAMRVAPVGVLMPADPVAALAERVAHVNEVTHNTGVANAGASAVATPVL